MEIISVLTSAHKCCCFCCASLERCKPKGKGKKEFDQQKPVIFPGSGRQKAQSFFLLFSESLFCVSGRISSMLPFVPGDRKVFAMATWEAAFGLCRASLGHLVDDGRFLKLWISLCLTSRLTCPCSCSQWPQGMGWCSLAFHRILEWFGFLGSKGR